MIEEAHQQKAKTLAENANRVREKYGNISDYYVLKVVEAELENAACLNCSGLPCKKRTNQNYKRIPQYNELYNTISVANAPCKFIQSYWRQNKLKSMFQAADIPAQYVGLTFDDYDVDADNQRAVRFAHSLINHIEGGAFFFGNYGTGKTMLAAIIAQEHLKAGREVIFIQLPDLLRNVRKTYQKDSELSDIDVLEKLYKVPVLIIDDISAVPQRKYAGETLFSIIDARYNARLQTIMTSNNTLQEIQTAFDNPTDVKDFKVYNGSRIYDRCKQMCQPVELKGSSRRRQ